MDASNYEDETRALLGERTGEAPVGTADTLCTLTPACCVCWAALCGGRLPVLHVAAAAAAALVCPLGGPCGHHR